jgi:hypothetical protein
MKLKHLLILLTLIPCLTLLIGCGDGYTDPADENGKSSDKEKGSDNADSDTDSEEGPDNRFYDTACPDVGVGAGSFSTQYASGRIRVEGSDKTYAIHTNWWHEYDGQTVAYNGLSFEVGNPNNVDVGQSDGRPAGYPSIFIGSYSGNTTQESNLPIKVSSIKTAPTSFHTNSTEGGLANKNAAYDVWLTATGDPLPSSQYSPGAGGAYLMVWLFKPTDRQPRGRNAHPAHAVEGAEGAWDVWVDPSNPPCISYVATEPIDGLDFDLNAFIRDSVDNEYGLTDDMYLSVIFAGFEIWGGGDGLTVDRFCAAVY